MTNEPAVSDQDPPTAGSNVIPPITSYLGDHTINVPILTSVVLDCNIGANHDIREATGVEVVIVLYLLMGRRCSLIGISGTPLPLRSECTVVGWDSVLNGTPEELNSVQVTVRPSVMACFDTGGGPGPTSLCPAVHLSMLHE